MKKLLIISLAFAVTLALSALAAANNIINFVSPFSSRPMAF